MVKILYEKILCWSLVKIPKNVLEYLLVVVINKGIFLKLEFLLRELIGSVKLYGFDIFCHAPV